MKKNIKTKRLLLIVLIVTAVLWNIPSLSYATGTIYPASIIGPSDVELTGSIPNYSNANAVGGLSVGTSHNRLYTLKANETHHVAVLYYYSNLYSSAAPKRIVFKNYLLGHANGMTADSNYLYITGWQSSGSYKSRIMRISRAAVAAMSDGYVVKYNSSTDLTPDGVEINRTINGTTYTILKEFKPKKTNGNPYNYNITSISRFNSQNGTVWFVIPYFGTALTDISFDTSGGLAYTIATLDSNGFTVSEDIKDIFFVYINQHSYQYTSGGTVYTKQLTSHTEQDIFYSAAKGFYIPMVDNNNGQSLIVRVDMTPYQATHTTLTTLHPCDIALINVLSGYEIESMAFVKRDSTQTQTCLKVIINGNVFSDGNAYGYYHLLSDAKNLLS